MARKVSGPRLLGLTLAGVLSLYSAFGTAGPGKAAPMAPVPATEDRGPARLALQAAGALDIARNLQALDMASELQALSQTMTIRSLLAALSIDKEPNISALSAEHDRFDRIIKGMRHGDEELGLAKAENPLILQKLARLEKEWSIFGPVARKIVKNGKVSKRNVAIVAECIKPLAEGTRELIEVVQYFVTGGRTFSLLTSMIGATEAQHALINEMAAGYLLIAYGHKPKFYRSLLQEQMAHFDRTLKGLLAGDSGLQLLPAPTSTLERQFRGALRLWRAHLPALVATAEGGKVDRETIPDFMRSNDTLAAEIDKATELYKSI